MNEFWIEENISKATKWIASPVDPMIKSFDAYVFSNMSSEAENQKRITNVGKFFPGYVLFQNVKNNED